MKTNKIGSPVTIIAILVFLAFVLWVTLDKPNDCLLSDEIAIAAARSKCNDINLLCSGIPTSNVMPRDLKQLSFNDAVFQLNCKSKELYLYDVKLSDINILFANKYQVNINGLDMAKKDKLSHYLDFYTNKFVLDGYVIEKEGDGVREGGAEFRFVTMSSGSKHVVIQFLKENGALLFYRKK